LLLAITVANDRVGKTRKQLDGRATCSAIRPMQQALVDEALSGKLTAKPSQGKP
jgi:hypothetical protein